MLQFLGLCHHFRCPIVLANVMHWRCNGCLEQCRICAILLINVKERYKNLNPTRIMWFDQTFWSSRSKMMTGGRGQGGSWICLAAFNNLMSELRYVMNINSMLISLISFSAMNAVMMFTISDKFVQCNEKSHYAMTGGGIVKNAMQRKMQHVLCKVFIFSRWCGEILREILRENVYACYLLLSEKRLTLNFIWHFRKWKNLQHVVSFLGETFIQLCQHWPFLFFSNSTLDIFS